MTTATLACNFPGCEEKNLRPETAMVPSIKAVQQAECGRPVTPAILANHVFCQEHGALGRSQSSGMFSYAETITRLERRAADRTTAKTFFAKYGATPKTAAPGRPAAKPQSPKTAMQIALEKGGVVKPSTPRVVELPVAVAAGAGA